jgi:two-component system cell cycle response regulator
LTERILIADGSGDAGRTLRLPLEAEGFPLTLACDAQDAMSRLNADPHSVVLLDVELPGGALDLLDEMKTDPDLAGTSVVAMSDDLSSEHIEQALERGAMDVLHKSAGPVEVVSRTRSALRSWQLQRRLREGNERLTELAATDDLTGLLARRFLESHLRGLVASAGRHGRPLSLVMLDLDEFKAINDTHGHPVGDRVLRTVVERMRSRLRREDLLGRWGGDEMMLVLPDIDLDGAVTAAEHVRRAVAETAVVVDGERIAITISAGAAAWNGESAEDLIQHADAALYDAKAAGRDRVCPSEFVRAA